MSKIHVIEIRYNKFNQVTEISPHRTVANLSEKVFLAPPAAVACPPARQLSCFREAGFSLSPLGDPPSVGVPESVSVSTKMSSFSTLLSSPAKKEV